jgi:hypothetical protein
MVGGNSFIQPVSLVREEEFFGIPAGAIKRKYMLYE